MEERRTSAAARIVAVLALIGAVIVIVIAVSAAMNSSSSDSSHHSKHHAQKEKTKHRTKAKTYTVESGDTLTAIAHKTGVPLSEIMALNPGVDPQILTAGEVLKLK
ncbi:MAG TPA: LysM domain-containing protein [Solirubrobacterales bacterium]|nr:LysM domain-containing protein [Solirubrobacterales bacterium]